MDPARAAARPLAAQRRARPSRHGIRWTVDTGRHALPERVPPERGFVRDEGREAGPGPRRLSAGGRGGGAAPSAGVSPAKTSADESSPSWSGSSSSGPTRSSGWPGGFRAVSMPSGGGLSSMRLSPAMPRFGTTPTSSSRNVLGKTRRMEPGCGPRRTAYRTSTDHRGAEASAPTASRIFRPQWPVPVPERRTRRRGHVPGLRRRCPALDQAGPPSAVTRASRHVRRPRT